MSTPLDRQHSAAETSPAHWPATAHSSWQPETTAEHANGAHEPLARIEGWVQATHGGITHYLYLATDDTGGVNRERCSRAFWGMLRRQQPTSSARPAWHLNPLAARVIHPAGAGATRGIVRR